MNTCTLVLKEDSKNTINNRILSYIRENQESLVYDHSILFKFECVSGKKKYKDITRCPTLIVGKKRYEGNQILQYLKDPNPQARPPPRKASKADPFGNVDSYFDSVILDEEDGEKKIDLGSQLNQAIQGRAQMDAPAGRQSRIPGKYDSLATKLNKGGGPPQEHIPDDDYRNDFEDLGMVEEPDEFHSYAMSVAGGM